MKFKPLMIMAIFATILNLLGCTGRKKENTLYPLSKQMLDTISDENLLFTVFENLSHKLPADYEKEYKTVLGWNKSQQSIYMIWLLEGEVNNGGFNQFYFNSSGQFCKHLPDALKLVGANKFSELMKQANQTYEKENAKITGHQDGSLEGFSKSYDENPLNQYDEKFYDIYNIENLERIQIEYIRNHINDFIDK